MAQKMRQHKTIVICPEEFENSSELTRWTDPDCSPISRFVHTGAQVSLRVIKPGQTSELDVDCALLGGVAVDFGVYHELKNDERDVNDLFLEDKDCRAFKKIVAKVMALRDPQNATLVINRREELPEAFAAIKDACGNRFARAV